MMVIDSETNFLYLADSLPIKYPKFHKQFVDILNIHKVNFALLPNTKDVWAVDYMPIQVAKNSFIQFKYNPDYLQNKKWRKTISDVDGICDALNIKRIKSDIILDGGNVIRCKDKVIMCDKIFKENSQYTKEKLTARLRNLFQVDELYFIPKEPYDIIGHADGMVRFLDDKTVLINKHRNKVYTKSLIQAIKNARLDYIELPYNPYENKSYLQANGCYMNYLQMENIVMIPIFGIKEDEAVVKQAERLFSGYSVATTDCNDIADEGGVLNCISWNIRRSN